MTEFGPEIVAEIEAAEDDIARRALGGRGLEATEDAVRRFRHGREAARRDPEARFFAAGVALADGTVLFSILEEPLKLHLMEPLGGGSPNAARAAVLDAAAAQAWLIGAASWTGKLPDAEDGRHDFGERRRLEELGRA